jgi:hypothetical protein
VERVLDAMEREPGQAHGRQAKHEILPDSRLWVVGLATGDMPGEPEDQQDGLIEVNP